MPLPEQDLQTTCQSGPELQLRMISIYPKSYKEKCSHNIMKFWSQKFQLQIN